MDLSAFIIAQSQSHPTLASIVMLLGVTRTIFKPLMGLIEAFVLATPTTNDDQVVTLLIYRSPRDGSLSPSQNSNYRNA